MRAESTDVNDGELEKDKSRFSSIKTPFEAKNLQRNHEIQWDVKQCFEHTSLKSMWVTSTKIYLTTWK